MKDYYKFMKEVVFILFDTCIQLILELVDTSVKILVSQVKYKNIIKMLLIIRLDAIGDFILWLDSAQHFRKIYPDKKIILLGNQAWTDLAKKLSYWDEVWELDRNKFIRNLFYRFQLLKRVRRAGFDVVVQPSYSRFFIYGDAVIRVSGARERICSIGDLSNIRPHEKRISDRFYTRLIPASPKPLMELERNAEFIRALRINVHAGPPDLSQALEGVINPVDDIKDYNVLFPGASRKERMWPISRFAALVEKIFQHTGWTVVVCGSQAEYALAESLISTTNDVPILNMMGKTDLAQLAAVIKDAHLLVGNETVAIHFAAAVSTPSFCLLGGGHYGRFVPYDLESQTERPLPVPIIHRMDCFGCNWTCRYSLKKGSAFPCIANIEVDDVLALIEPFLPRIG